MKSVECPECHANDSSRPWCKLCLGVGRIRPRDVMQHRCGFHEVWPQYCEPSDPRNAFVRIELDGTVDVVDVSGKTTRSSMHASMFAARERIAEEEALARISRPPDDSGECVSDGNGGWCVEVPE